MDQGAITATSELGSSRSPLHRPEPTAEIGTTQRGGALVKPVKIGAKVVRHGRYVTFQLAKAAVAKGLFEIIVRLIDDLRRRPAPTSAGALITL